MTLAGTSRAQPTEARAARRAARPEIRIFHTSVSGVEQLNPHMVRITLQGGDLITYESAGPDSFIYVFFPRAGAEHRHAIEHDFTWEYWRTLPEDERQVGRYYTVRSFDRARATMVLDIVIHGDGPGSTWASARASKGDAVAFWGPRTAYGPPDDTTRWLLLGDETALPAIGAILEALPADARADAVVELSDASAVVPLVSAASFSVQWLFRDGAEAGLTSALYNAVRAMKPEAPGIYAWAGGEHEAMKTIKAHLADKCGLRGSQLSLVGYWRHRAHPDD
jgi:NADPH-dependent ferric siderophore reductase